MNEPLDQAPRQPGKENPEKLVLRGRPRPVVRFRRGVIVGVTGAVAISLVTLSWLAFQPPNFRKGASAISSEGPAPAALPDPVAGAPKSYGDVPRLGSPLPGDLGRPILEHERDVAAGGFGQAGDARSETDRSTVASERERRADIERAARASPVLIQLGRGEGHPDMPAAALQPAFSSPDVPLSPAAANAGQQQKIAFANVAEKGDINPDRLHPALSPYTLAAGTIIPASLITGINSDLPGMVIAQVTENVSDSATGRFVLIPQGARLIGRYDSLVAFGQRRALVIWNRILFPDGSSVDLDNMPAADVSGYAGLRDRVDSHAWQLLKGIALSTLLGVGTQLSLGSSESDLVRAVRESAQQNAANAGTQITSHELNVQPTIQIRPGWPVRAILNKDLVLEP